MLIDKRLFIVFIVPSYHEDANVSEVECCLRHLSADHDIWCAVMHIFLGSRVGYSFKKKKRQQSLSHCSVVRVWIFLCVLIIWNSYGKFSYSYRIGPGCMHSSKGRACFQNCTDKNTTNTNMWVCVCVCSHTCTHILNLHKSHYLNGVKLKRTHKNNHTLKLN